MGAFVPRISSIPNAAAHFDVSDKTIRRWIREGRLTSYRIGPKTLRIDLDEVDAMLADSKIPKTG
jgi:excisionase family DNA binding protein